MEQAGAGIRDTSGWRAFFSLRVLTVLFMGFSSGLPLYTLLYLTQAWLAKSGLGLKELGLFSIVMFPYTFKFLSCCRSANSSCATAGARR